MGNETGEQSPADLPPQPADPPSSSSRWSLIPVWGRASIIAVPILIVALVVILLLVNARPSLESVASDCGGRTAGIHVDESGILIDMSHGSDALVCVLPKVLSDKGEQYAVALASDEGDTSTMTLSGLEFKFGTLDGARFVFIGTP